MSPIKYVLVILMVSFALSTFIVPIILLLIEKGFNILNFIFLPPIVVLLFGFIVDQFIFSISSLAGSYPVYITQELR